MWWPVIRNIIWHESTHAANPETQLETSQGLKGLCPASSPEPTGGAPEVPCDSGTHHTPLKEAPASEQTVAPVDTVECRSSGGAQTSGSGSPGVCDASCSHTEEEHESAVEGREDTHDADSRDSDVDSEGGGEAQAVIEGAHAMGLKMAVVLWHADWCPLADKVQREMQDLAAQHPGVMFMCVDVEASPDNRQLAFEKIMKAPTAQRQGAKPVLKSGAKWPAITVHQPPILQPILAFEGSDACGALQQHLISAAHLVQPDVHDSVPAEAGDDKDTLEEEEDITSEHSGAQQQDDDQEPGCIDEQQDQSAAQNHVTQEDVPKCSEWRQGAVDMRECYKRAAGSNSAALTLIVDSASQSVSFTKVQVAWNESIRLHADVVFAMMDIQWSESNRMLAAKLGSSLKCPALLLKRPTMCTTANHSRSGITDAGKAVKEETAETQSREARAQSTPADKCAQKKPAAPTVQLLQNVNAATLRSTVRANSCIIAEHSAAPVCSGKHAEEESCGSSPNCSSKQTRAGKPQRKSKSIYNPPEGAAKRPGTYRRFGKRGMAVYWPRMPCLRCGCPWWLGEDWDAQCVRCKWSCETEGYDDDSRPLRKGGWAERYDKFTALLKQGITAPWPPV